MDLTTFLNIDLTFDSETFFLLIITPISFYRRVFPVIKHINERDHTIGQSMVDIGLEYSRNYAQIYFLVFFKRYLLFNLWNFTTDHLVAWPRFGLLFLNLSYHISAFEKVNFFLFEKEREFREISWKGRYVISPVRLITKQFLLQDEHRKHNKFLLR
jgi:hypothetical protein